VVGESGCGKTTTAKLVLGLEEPTGGTILFEGRDLDGLDTAGRRHYRKSVQAVFQDPYASLNPRMRISAIVAEPLITNETVDPAEVRQRTLSCSTWSVCRNVRPISFPHEFSGGQRQRIAIARALVLSPRLVVLDEPVSALDVSIRRQILNLLRDLQARLGLSYLFIAHDLAAVAHMSHEIVVMYLGKIVESGDARALADNAMHPYTKALFSAALPSHPDERREDVVLPGRGAEPAQPAPAATSIRAARTPCRAARWRRRRWPGRRPHGRLPSLRLARACIVLVVVRVRFGKRSLPTVWRSMVYLAPAARFFFKIERRASVADSSSADISTRFLVRGGSRMLVLKRHSGFRRLPGRRPSWHQLRRRGLARNRCRAEDRCEANVSYPRLPMLADPIVTIVGDATTSPSHRNVESTLSRRRGIEPLACSIQVGRGKRHEAQAASIKWAVIVHRLRTWPPPEPRGSVIRLYRPQSSTRLVGRHSTLMFAAWMIFAHYRGLSVDEGRLAERSPGWRLTARRALCADCPSSLSAIADLSLHPARR
jgi:ABC-type oligopeptide transport system ATPase subunit